MKIKVDMVDHMDEGSLEVLKNARYTVESIAISSEPPAFNGAPVFNQTIELTLVGSSRPKYRLTKEQRDVLKSAQILGFETAHRAMTDHYIALDKKGVEEYIFTKVPAPKFMIEEEISIDEILRNYWIKEKKIK